MRPQRVIARIVGIILPILLLAVAHPVQAERFHAPVQVTTNPGEDFAGTVSADGRFMVYVSDRSGNLDLWRKQLGGLSGGVFSFFAGAGVLN